jgi:hypothetical protein
MGIWFLINVEGTYKDNNITYEERIYTQELF